MSRDELLREIRNIAEDAAYARGHMHGADDPTAMAREVAELVSAQVGALLDADTNARGKDSVA